MQRIVIHHFTGLLFNSPTVKRWWSQEERKEKKIWPWDHKKDGVIAESRVIIMGSVSHIIACIAIVSLFLYLSLYVTTTNVVLIINCFTVQIETRVTPKDTVNPNGHSFQIQTSAHNFSKI